MKTCSVCNELKDLSCYYKNRTRTDGHDYECKDCQKKRRAPEKTRTHKYVAAKTCRTCNKTLDRSCFHKRSAAADGLARICKECMQAYNRELTARNKLVQKEWVDEKACTNCGEQLHRSSFHSDPSKKDGLTSHCNVCIRQWQRRNRPALRELENKRRSQNIEVRIADALRANLLSAVKYEYKSGSAIRDLGCTIPELRLHLQGQFRLGMSWDNWGELWQIDHFYPLAAAQLQVRSQVLAVCNWQNLQPLTKKENISKRDRVYPEAQKLFDKLCREFSKKEDAA